MNGPPDHPPPRVRPKRHRPGQFPDRDIGEIFSGGLGTLVNYIHMRAILVLLELREAGVAVGLKVGLLAVAALSFGIGYFAILFAAMAFVVSRVGWSWPMTVLVFGGAHIALSVVAFLISLRYPKTPLFQDTMNELEKDRVWLSDKDPEKE